MLVSDDGRPDRFPARFTHIWLFDRPEDLTAALIRLSSCHQHNFAVQMDRSQPAIWGSSMAMDCITMDQALRESSDPYDGVESLLFGLLKDWFGQHTATRRRDMPGNIALDLRRTLQRMGVTLTRAEATRKELR